MREKERMLFRFGKMSAAFDVNSKKRGEDANRGGRRERRNGGREQVRKAAASLSSVSFSPSFASQVLV